MAVKSIINWNNSCLNDDFFPIIMFKHGEDGVFIKDVYDDLKNNFPIFSDFKVTNSGQAHRTNIELRENGTSEHKHNLKVLSEKYPDYYKMFTYFNSSEFKDEIFKRFNKDVMDKYGFIGNTHLNISVLVQICKSTGGYENPFHVDTRKRIVHGLVYFGMDDIESGGELCIGKHTSLKEWKDYPQYPNLQNIEEVQSFDPEDNFGLFVLSTPNSYHKGNATIGTRKFLYISIDYTSDDGGSSSNIAWESGWGNNTKPFSVGLKNQKNDKIKYEQIQKGIPKQKLNDNRF